MSVAITDVDEQVPLITKTDFKPTSGAVTCNTLTMCACTAAGCCCCNVSLAGMCGSCCPCCNQLHCKYYHYPDVNFCADLYKGKTGHTCDPAFKESNISLAEFKYFEFSRKLAEMSYASAPAIPLPPLKAASTGPLVKVLLDFSRISEDAKIDDSLRTGSNDLFVEVPISALGREVKSAIIGKYGVKLGNRSAESLQLKFQGRSSMEEGDWVGSEFGDYGNMALDSTKKDGKTIDASIFPLIVKIPETVREYADKHLTGLLTNMTYWQHSTSVAITCNAKVPFTDGEREILCVIFRGTASATDAWYDATSSHTTDFYASDGKRYGRSSLGFNVAYDMFRKHTTTASYLTARSEIPNFQSMLPDSTATFMASGGLCKFIEGLLKKEKYSPLLRKEIYVVGHSLGGSIAQLFSADMIKSGWVDKVQLATFGSPRALGHKLAADPDILSKIKHCRLVNTYDLVPQFPLYGTEDPSMMAANVNTGFRNENLAFFRKFQKSFNPLSEKEKKRWCGPKGPSKEEEYEDPHTERVRKHFERKQRAIELRYRGKTKQRYLDRLELRRPPDVNGGHKFLGTTRHFGRVFYCQKYGEEGGVIWRELDTAKVPGSDDFHGMNKLLKGTFTRKVEEGAVKVVIKELQQELIEGCRIEGVEPILSLEKALAAAEAEAAAEAAVAEAVPPPVKGAPAPVKPPKECGLVTSGGANAQSVLAKTKGYIGSTQQRYTQAVADWLDDDPYDAEHIKHLKKEMSGCFVSREDIKEISAQIGRAQRKIEGKNNMEAKFSASGRPSIWLSAATDTEGGDDGKVPCVCPPLSCICFNTPACLCCEIDTKKVFANVSYCCENSFTSFLDCAECLLELPETCRILNLIPCCSTIRTQVRRVVWLTVSLLKSSIIGSMRLAYIIKPPGPPGGFPHLREANSHSLGGAALPGPAATKTIPVKDRATGAVKKEKSNPNTGTYASLIDFADEKLYQYLHDSFKGAKPEPAEDAGLTAESMESR